ncbi:Uncharacterized protein OS=Isosphaera pallida (strain ATCC 43644 / DSM 9630 / IS1B) GN=Isop_0849 PE=4 SV=1: Peptidase_MA_2 [Gemmataceae bacterium]|nr:Uncharacterized protein OS=Isosphaera pallida (strain ATCC 43644 / DSM 9630 / IS1B) GN=Isop_0849 PE=4 SV=1: Peptidase_MA_2 [Gemmataceae bacterium]VTU00620.1 Uncharacterized protein OS=Isosphaera pallida (strain ATCC 43644 / DSM 9630 / IS1B) GN=Isop_0849 PE=4 SV=1: Peptidase_MA_2 [Gemmataceae bacterium]
MTLRRFYTALVLAALASPGDASAANFETPNFSVEAPTPELARKFGEMAEAYRKEKALEWLGHEMPQWPRKCPLQVQVSMGSAGGATTFTFGSDQGRPVVSSQRMEIRGDAKQLLYSVLPHEVTHTVLAHHFGRPVPRWADEGGSVLSENDEERFSHDVRCREILNAGRAFVLRTLFRMTEYPRDMTVLYAQGYSVTAYLVDKGGNGREGRGKLLQFLGGGMNGNTAESWNEAARKVYGFESIDALERAWLDALRTPPSRLVARGPPRAARSRPRLAPRHADLRAPHGTPHLGRPAMPLLEPPVRAARGAAPAYEPASPAAQPMAPSYPPPVLGPPELPRTR